MYSSDGGHKVYDSKFWWSDDWDPIDYRTEYDFNTPFFEQFSNLLKRIPLLALSVVNSVNSDYTNFVDGNKNCYLLFGSGWNENVNYSAKSMSSKDSMDVFISLKNELCYECVSCFECYRLFWSYNCKNCTDSYFLYDCRGCTSCVGCSNLVNKSYHIFNEPYSKEEYYQKLKEFNLETYDGLRKFRKKFKREVYSRSIHRFAGIFNSQNITGDNVNNSKNCKFCFDVLRSAEDSKFILSSLESKDNYDGIGQYKNNLSYENVDNNIGQRQISSVTIYSSNDVFYSYNCHSSHNIFGCVGLRNKQYCILNKQYSKEEYKKILPMIIEHMNKMPYIDKKGNVYGYGEFFPIEISPFAYNDTIAQEYFPLTKEQILEKGYKWRNLDTKIHQVTKKHNVLPSSIKNVDNSILKEVLGCIHEGRCFHQCTTAFKIIPQELAFYKKMNLPIPRLCPNCRHYERLAQRNPLKLWKRKCMCSGKTSENGIYQNTTTHQNHGEGECSNEFETSYSPDRKEIVYCEQCYQSEVV